MLHLWVFVQGFLNFPISIFDQSISPHSLISYAFYIFLILVGPLMVSLGSGKENVPSEWKASAVLIWTWLSLLSRHLTTNPLPHHPSLNRSATKWSCLSGNRHISILEEDGMLWCHPDCLKRKLGTSMPVSLLWVPVLYCSGLLSAVHTGTQPPLLPEGFPSLYMCFWDLSASFSFRCHL